MSALFIVLGVLAASYAARAVFAALRTAHQFTTPESLQAIAAGRTGGRLDESGLVAARLSGAITAEHYRHSIERSLAPAGAGRMPVQPTR